MTLRDILFKAKIIKQGVLGGWKLPHHRHRSLSVKTDCNYLMYHDLLTKLIKLNNVTLNAIKILQDRCFEKENHRNNCMNYNDSIVIDMVNENICMCQRQPNVFMPLTEENLIYRLKNFPKDLWMDLMNGIGISKACDSCTRLYSSKFQKDSIENTLINRRRL